MDRIMLNKIRNCAWQAKMKSAWYIRVQAPLEFFFFFFFLGQKPDRSDHGSKERVSKIETVESFTK